MCFFSPAYTIGDVESRIPQSLNSSKIDIWNIGTSHNINSDLTVKINWIAEGKIQLEFNGDINQIFNIESFDQHGTKLSSFETQSQLKREWSHVHPQKITIHHDILEVDMYIRGKPECFIISHSKDYFTINDPVVLTLNDKELD